LPQSREKMSACSAGSAVPALAAIAQDFSPRYELYGDDVVVIDISGLERLLGPARTIGEELQRAVSTCGFRANVAIAGTQIAALILAGARPGLTVIERGGEADALAPLEVRSLKSEVRSEGRSTSSLQASLQTSDFQLQTFERWGIRTLGELAS